MSDQERFIEQVMKNLESNGFPGKKVSLPVEKMYEVADMKGLNFNKTLEVMKDRGVVSEITVDKVIFSKTVQNPFEGFDMSILKNLSKKEGMEKISEIMSKITPEQMEEIQKMYEKMTPEEREEIIKKSEDMGFS